MPSPLSVPLITLLALCAFTFNANAGPAAANIPDTAETNFGDRTANESYLLLAGADDMNDMLKQFNLRFAAAQPNVNVKMVLKGSVTGLPALTAGAASMALLTHDPSPAEISAFRQVWGYAPQAIRIGYAGFGPDSRHKLPPAVYINQRNPLTSLTTQQLTQVFTVGSVAGDINFWSQLGLKGAWEQRRIHLYGLRDNGGIATALRSEHLGKQPFSPQYEALASPQAVLDAVADDPYGIALLGPATIGPNAAALRILPLASANGATPITPSRGNVAAGKYPLSVYVRIYVNRAPGKALDASVKNYLETLLSPAGQGLIADVAEATGYLPLSADDLLQEKKKLD
ncbi:Phosphate ABC transporter [Collimonas arenae]|uniref:Phosphate ABC transporter n=1 Tax=Collimonas arenae TaxID=279058 RepID=A0A0A1FCM9_9BURK|nr:Phosphate ABC transporter [Collimonas arenae]